MAVQPDLNPDREVVMYQQATTTRRQARTLRLERLVTVLLLAIAAAGLPGCDETDPTGADLTTSAEGAQAGVEASTVATDGSSTSTPTAAATLATIPLPINQSIATSGVAFGITQTGGGPGAFFKISQAASAKDALLGQIAGQGNAVHGLSTGTGHAGLFETTNPSSFSTLLVIGAGAEGIRVQERGLGRAGVFENVNANSTAPTLFSETLAKGEAGSFLTSNPSNQTPTLRVETKSPGIALQGIAVGGFAVRGIATTGVGGIFQNGSASTLPALAARTNGSGFAAEFQATNAAGKGVLIKTNGGAGLQVVGGSFQVVGGAKNAVVATPSGAKALYTEESTEVWFTDYGFGKLSNGKRILFDPSFAQTINPDESYHVFVQPYGRAELYVAERTPLGFTVALKDGDPNAEFSYRIVAKRLGFEGKRLEAAPWADQLPARD
jgi:hypothetical protein